MEFRRKFGQSNLVAWKKGNQYIDLQAAGEIEKILPRRHAKGVGKKGAGTWVGIGQTPETTRGKVRGQGETCSLPVTPEQEARMRAYLNPPKR